MAGLLLIVVRSSDRILIRKFRHALFRQRFKIIAEAKAYRCNPCSPQSHTSEKLYLDLDLILGKLQIITFF